ncbi:hypothetical protein MLD52_07920 [Puniceicoccaceae bacterium K14]|nr:hypothetical protein [Puniceicoccaceae bacterium K14]
MDTKLETAKPNGKSNGATQNGNGLAGHDEMMSEHAFQSLIHRVKSGIDENGKYKDQMYDISAGYAAAKGLSIIAVKSQIEARFTQEFDISPRDYLDAHYDELRENGYDVAPQREPRQTKSKGRGR